MKANWPWSIFLGLIGFLILGYTGLFFSKVYHYGILTQQAPVTSIYWSIYAIEEDRFAPQADYTFIFEGKPYEGRTIWDDGERYPSPWALEKPMDTLSSQEWQVWLSPRDPAHSSLQKKFPTKDCVYTAILWLLFSYFIMLGQYAERRRSSDANHRIGKPRVRRRVAASHVSAGPGDDADQL